MGYGIWGTIALGQQPTKSAGLNPCFDGIWYLSGIVVDALIANENDVLILVLMGYDNFSQIIFV